MDIITVIAGVLLGNYITLLGVYALWRLKRNDNDGRAILLLLCVFAVSGAVFLLGK